jgi:signal transduction histidine kinase
MEVPTDLRCRVEIDAAVADQMTAEQARHIVYIVREALSNSVRHAAARNEVISLQRHDEQARLTIEDDGNGFNTDLIDGKGEGLKNMAARANKLGASFEMRSELGRGTRLIFDIPTRRVHA